MRIPSEAQTPALSGDQPEAVRSDDINGLQPSNLLSPQARAGRFSLNTVLGQAVTRVREEPLTTEDDPVEQCLLPYHIAVSLFEG